MEALLAHEPEHLLAEEQLQALEVQLAGSVARQVFAVSVPGLSLFAGDAACLAKVVVFVNVKLDVALVFSRY